jgi:hypothetical protein
MAEFKKKNKKKNAYNAKEKSKKACDSEQPEDFRSKPTPSRLTRLLIIDTLERLMNRGLAKPI